MRKVVNVSGRKVFVYRKGHENKLLGRTFVKHWKEGKVGPPSNGKHTLQTDTNGNLRVITSRLVGHRRIPYKKLGLHRVIHRKNYKQLRNALKEVMPNILQDQKMLQSVTLTNQQYASKYNLRKEKIQIHPNIEHVLVSGADNDNAINSIAQFMRVIIRRIKIKNGLTENDRIQLFMHTKKKPIKTSVLKIKE